MIHGFGFSIAFRWELKIEFELAEREEVRGGLPRIGRGHGKTVAEMWGQPFCRAKLRCSGSRAKLIMVLPRLPVGGGSSCELASNS